MQGEDVLVKRTTLEKYSQGYYPVFKNEGGKRYIIAYDPSSRADNSVIMVAELFRDEERGLMLKIINCRVLVEVMKDGSKQIIQKPEQVEILKEIMLDYNIGFQDYEALEEGGILIDGGAGGGGFEIAQYLLKDFKGKDGMIHRGIIDSENEYMKLRVDDYPAAADILTIFNFKRDKTAAYDATAAALAQGLVIWPKPLNIRNEMEFEEQKEDGSLYIRYEKPNLAEVNALIQIDLAKTELQGMQKSKRPNGTIVYEQTPEAKQNSLGDDRSDAACMLCWKLMQLRSADALDVEKPSEDFKKIYGARLKNSNNKMASKKVNPFINRNNPFRR